ncbi:MAG TPA: UvrD-helicase domain-containing protein, partial [Candidatus Krumholzibacteria bacterium]|nr:UvrD-helicase domain-containing protein [Candidatus Krumholzibacteria bacterium]
MTELDLESELNPEQISAVTHGEGPQLVLAGAGTGKTRVITYRVAWLVRERGIDPASIVAVTFTNKAASEMRERTEQLLGQAPLATFLGTFHRFSLGLLRRYGERVGVAPGFVIFDRDDQLKLVKRGLEAEGLAEQSFPPRKILAAIGSAKNRLLDAASYAEQAYGFFNERVAKVFRHYQGELRQANAVDFDDMLALAVRLLREDSTLAERMREQIRYLLVDEFQDTNHAQLKLVEKLAGPAGNLTAVGDEDQGIYRWRGADLDNILRFEKSFPGATVRKLERNYRSTETILEAAGEVVSHNRDRRGKSLWTDAGAGAPITLYWAGDEQDEASWLIGRLQELSRDELQWSDMAILVRTNAQTRALEEELMSRGMPYTLVGSVRFYERAEIKDVLAYLRFLRNPHDNLALERILNQPPRGIGPATKEMAEQEAASSGISFWDYLSHSDLGNLPARSRCALEGFRDVILELQRVSEEPSLAKLVSRVLRDTGLFDLYSQADEESAARRENLQEFVSAVEEFSERHGKDEVASGEALIRFLDHVSLVSDLDSWQVERGVSVMTLHSAKGLEFPVVAVAGLEEGLLPHFNARELAEDIEEERRLLYVGMTR